MVEAGFLPDNQIVEYTEQLVVISVDNQLMEHCKDIHLNIDSETFNELYYDDFESFLESKLGDDAGYYEFDGDQGDSIYLVQLNDEEDDWEKNYKKNFRKIETYFKKRNLLKPNEVVSCLNILDNKTFVMTGDLTTYKNREELKSTIISLGGLFGTSISKKTDYLINNDSCKKYKSERIRCSYHNRKGI